MERLLDGTCISSYFENPLFPWTSGKSHANRKFDFGYLQLIDKPNLIYYWDNVYKVNEKGKINLGWTN